MSTRYDRNYRSWDSPAQGGAANITLDPVADGWVPGTWSDTAKFYKRICCGFMNFNLVLGGTEDCVDVSPECINNRFAYFTCHSGGQYVLTLKGGSCDNLFSGWTVHAHGKTVDIEIGNWSSSNYERSTGNQFANWTATDGKPITYCYRLGCKPYFRNMDVKHLWWRSIGLTIYWWAKYLWHVILKRPDK